jgi:integrase
MRFGHHLDTKSIGGMASKYLKNMEAPGGVEPPTNGLGNRCSIHLSYGATCKINYLQWLLTLYCTTDAQLLFCSCTWEGHMGRIQRGYIYEASRCFYVRYWTTEIVDGSSQRVQRSERLCEKSDKYYARNSKAVKLLGADFMHKVNQQVSRRAVTHAADMTVADFWEKIYLPYCEKEWKGTGMRPSTVRGYKQVWSQHLKAHFGTTTLQDYSAAMARRFLQSIKTQQASNTLKHIRALASAMFTEAIEKDLCDANPWKVKIPKDCKDSDPTGHYTMEDAEDMISALVDHVDGQLVIALACFLGLGPAEIAGLQRGDIDEDWIHIRRNRLLGKVVPPKTTERAADVPILDQVRVPLELWRKKAERTDSAEWVIPDLHNLVGRVIKPHVRGNKECARCGKIPAASGLEWKGLYAGRRGACTAVIEATNGNYAVAQALLRHKRMTTTLNVYKKQITPDAFEAGMKQFQKSLKG